MRLPENKSIKMDIHSAAVLLQYAQEEDSRIMIAQELADAAQQLALEADRPLCRRNMKDLVFADNDNYREVHQQLQFNWFKNVLTQTGMNLDNCFPDSDWNPTLLWNTFAAGASAQIEKQQEDTKDE